MCVNMLQSFAFFLLYQTKLLLLWGFYPSIYDLIDLAISCRGLSLIPRLIEKKMLLSLLLEKIPLGLTSIG